jgi:hypothetical protein
MGEEFLPVRHGRRLANHVQLSGKNPLRGSSRLSLQGLVSFSFPPANSLSRGNLGRSIRLLHSNDPASSQFSGWISSHIPQWRHRP